MNSKALLLSTVVALAGSQAAAATVVSLVGDIDGFGGQTAPGANAADTGFNFDNTSGSDPAFTDVWLYEQDGGVGGSPINYTHSYAFAGSVLSASLEITGSGMANDRGPWDVLVNGNLIGSIADSLGSTFSLLYTFDVDPAFLTGSDSVSLVYQDTAFEGYAIDYSQLTVEISPIPLPATGLLLVGALGALGAARRRKSAA